MASNSLLPEEHGAGARQLDRDRDEGEEGREEEEAKAGGQDIDGPADEGARVTQAEPELEASAPEPGAKAISLAPLLERRRR